MKKLRITLKTGNQEKISQHFKPPKDNYNYSRTSITCNPELNVVLHGQPRLVKLHFNASQKMTQERANIICALIEEAIGDHEFEYSVLDLTTGKEFFFNSNYEKTFDRIHTEITNLENNWDS